MEFKQITKQFILNNITEEDIFERFLGIKVVYNTLVRNPLRDDKNPTASFKFVNDRIQFRDWSEPFSRDCFNVVQFIYRCDYYKSLRIVASVFNLMEVPSDIPVINIDNIERMRNLSVKKTELRIKSIPFNKKHIEYWKQFHIPVELLHKFNVVPISGYWLNGDYKPCSDIAFAYCFGGYNYKLYFPNRKAVRFLQNCTVIQGYNKLPEYGSHCVLTKSYKDVIALSMFGIIGVACSSETVLPTVEQYSDLYNRFDNMFYLGDNDYRGKRAAVNYKHSFNLDIILFPKDEPKDFTDNLKKYGINEMIDVIEELKNKYGIIS